MGPLARTPGWPVFVIIMFGLVLSVLLKARKQWWIIILWLTLLLAGFWRYQLTYPDFTPRDIAYYNDQEEKIIFNAVVVKEVERGDDYQRLTLRVREIEADSVRARPINGKILVKTRLYPSYNYGDYLQLSCYMQSPAVEIEQFRYDLYLARYGIYSVCYQPLVKVLGHDQGSQFLARILALKRIFKRVVDESLPEPHAGIFRAMILGLQRGLPQDLLDNFSKTGTIHIISISGAHITVIAAIFLSLAIGLGLDRKKAFWLVSLSLTLYVILVGFPAPAVRSLIMGFLVLLARHVGRLNKSGNAFVFAAAAMLLANPRLLRDDLGFQLSFAAMAGLIYTAPLFEKWLEKWPEMHGAKEALVMTLSAQVFTLPLTMLKFGRISLIAPLANIAVVPILSFLMMFGLAALLVGTVSGIIGQIAFWPVWLILAYLIKSVEFFAAWPLAYLEVAKVPWWAAGMMYCVLVIGVYRLSKKLDNS